MLVAPPEPKFYARRISRARFRWERTVYTSQRLEQLYREPEFAAYVRRMKRFLTQGDTDAPSARGKARPPLLKQWSLLSQTHSLMHN